MDIKSNAVFKTIGYCFWHLSMLYLKHMEKIVFNGVDILNPIDGMLDEIIGYFVRFYGKAYGDRIEDKLKNTTYIFMPKLSGKNWKKKYSKVMKEFTEEKTDELFRELEKKLGIRLFYETNRRFAIAEITKAKEKFLAGAPLTYDQKFIIQSFSKGVKNWLYEKEKCKAAIACNIDEFLAIYQKTVKPKINKLLKERLNVLQELKKLLPDVEEIQDEAGFAVADEIAGFFYKMVAKRKINASVSKITRCVTTFTELVMQKQLPLITTAEQKRSYVELFKFLGINYGDEYSSYYKNKENFEHIIFDQPLAKKIEDIVVNAEERLKAENKLYMHSVETIEGLNIKYPQNKADISTAIYDFVYNHGTEAFTISYIEEGTNKLKQVCVCADYLAVATDTVVHEMNHLIEENLLFDADKMFCTKSGFDVLPYSKYADGEGYEAGLYYKTENSRNYEYLSEIFNEFFASQIFEMMDKDGFGIGLGENYCAYYRDAFPVFGKLICENKDKFVKIRTSADLNEVTKYMTREDFEKLAEIATEILEDEDFMEDVLTEIEEKTNVDTEDYAEFSEMCNFENLQGWSTNVKKLFKIINNINVISKKIKDSRVFTMYNSACKAEEKQ